MLASWRTWANYYALHCLDFNVHAEPSLSKGSRVKMVSPREQVRFPG